MRSEIIERKQVTTRSSAEYIVATADRFEKELGIHQGCK
jgi:hypothetical protein